MIILQQEIRDMKVRYRREQELMSSILHNTGMKNVRQHLRAPLRMEKTSFLGIQRNRVCFLSTLFLSCGILPSQNPHAVQTEVGGRGY
jgi:protein HOOK3